MCVDVLLLFPPSHITVFVQISQLYVFSYNEKLCCVRNTDCTLFKHNHKITAFTSIALIKSLTCFNPYRVPTDNSQVIIRDPITCWVLLSITQVIIVI